MKGAKIAAVVAATILMLSAAVWLIVDSLPA